MAPKRFAHLFFVLDDPQRQFAAKHLMNMGYGILATTTLRFIGGEFTSLVLTGLGIISYVLCFYTALHLQRGTHDTTIA